VEKALEQFLKASKVTLNTIGCVALTFMMVLTVADVILRAGGQPLIGTYEVVALLLALVIGFCFPAVSLDRGNVYMEIVLMRLSGRNRAILNTFTRMLAILLFALIAINLFSVGAEYRTSREVTATLRIPFYPVAYAVAVCCLVQCLVFVLHIIKIWRGRYE
jgi:TRAP-type C4-dicarboxylate transport system permease small subunit